MEPDDRPYGAVTGVARGHRIKVDPITLQSDHPYLFAAGDVESGATDITRAIGHGRRAAYMIDNWLNDRPLDGFPLFDDPLGVVDRDEVLARQQHYTHRGPVRANSVHSPRPPTSPRSSRP